MTMMFYEFLAGRHRVSRRIGLAASPAVVWAQRAKATGSVGVKRDA
jgi:hypothetical protein